MEGTYLDPAVMRQWLTRDALLRRIFGVGLEVVCLPHLASGGLASDKAGIAASSSSMPLGGLPGASTPAVLVRLILSIQERYCRMEITQQVSSSSDKGIFSGLWLRSAAGAAVASSRFPSADIFGKVVAKLRSPTSSASSSVNPGELLDLSAGIDHFSAAMVAEIAARASLRCVIRWMVLLLYVAVAAQVLRWLWRRVPSSLRFRSHVSTNDFLADRPLEAAEDMAIATSQPPADTTCAICLTSREEEADEAHRGGDDPVVTPTLRSAVAVWIPALGRPPAAATITAPQRPHDWTSLACTHSFHVACLCRWIVSAIGDQATCPVCRRPVADDVARGLWSSAFSAVGERGSIDAGVQGMLGRRLPAIARWIADAGAQWTELSFQHKCLLLQAAVEVAALIVRLATRRQSPSTAQIFRQVSLLEGRF